MNDQDFKLTVDQRVINKILPNYGLFVKLKKTMSCCSILVEPEVELQPIDALLVMKQEGKVILRKVANCTVAFEKEIFSIYTQQTDLKIQLNGILVKKPQINLQAEMIQKDKCIS